jgi:hypothetical protein
MTRNEIKEKLSEYYKLSCEAESVKKRIDILKASKISNSEITNRIEELSELYSNTLLNADNRLATTLEVINKLGNADGDVDVLKKYHIDGLSEKTIANQMCLTVDYIRTKRWRAYVKLEKII